VAIGVSATAIGIGLLLNEESTMQLIEPFARHIGQLLGDSSGPTTIQTELSTVPSSNLASSPVQEVTPYREIYRHSTFIESHQLTPTPPPLPPSGMELLREIQDPVPPTEAEIEKFERNYAKFLRGRK
jgi:hypothetical protein